MIHFAFSEKDTRYLFLKYDNETDYNILKNGLTDKINLTDPICFLKNFHGIPFKQEFLWEYRKQNGGTVFYTSIGMWYPIYKYFKANNIEFDGLDETKFKRKISHTREEFEEIVNSWSLSIKPRPYQLDAAYKILQWNRSVSSLATRAGKTLIAYMIFRYAMEYLSVKKILMIVPSIDLVKQGYSDFSDYAEFFNTECVWGGGKLVESSNLTIGTFQSLVNFLDKKSKKYKPDFFNDYDMIFVDETHRANAISIKNIISQPFMSNVKIAFGMTGTLPKENTIESYCLHSLLGAKIQEITPKELMDAGYISKLQIYQHRITYKNKLKQLKTWCTCAEYCLKKFKTIASEKDPSKKERVPLKDPHFLIAYEKEANRKIDDTKAMIFANSLLDEEQKWLEYKSFLENCIKESDSANMLHVEVMSVHFFEERIDYLISQLKNCPNNTLILAQHVEYIKHIADRIRKAFPDRPVVCVYGASKERKDAKTVFKEHNNVIMVANYGIMSTGITLSNLCYGFLFESFKSNVVNMQSIGRGLGLSSLKEKYILHDITDTFDAKYASKKIFLQGIERTKIYKEQNYDYKVVNIEL